MSNIVLIRIILPIFLLIIFMTSCSISESKDNSTNSSQQATSQSQVTNDWTFDKLVEESDCCIVISKIEMINENSPELSRGVSREVENEFKMNVTLIEYNQNDLGKLPATITILEGESPFLEEFESNYLIVFLKQAENYSEFYITGNKNGVIETDFSTLKSSYENIQHDLNKLFNNEYLKFKEWRENEFIFSDKIIIEPYSNVDSNTIYPFFNVPTNSANVAQEGTTINTNTNSNKIESTTSYDSP